MRIRFCKCGSPRQPAASHVETAQEQASCEPNRDRTPDGTPPPVPRTCRRPFCHAIRRHLFHTLNPSKPTAAPPRRYRLRTPRHLLVFARRNGSDSRHVCVEDQVPVASWRNFTAQGAMIAAERAPQPRYQPLDLPSAPYTARLAITRS